MSPVKTTIFQEIEVDWVHFETIWSFRFWLSFVTKFRWAWEIWDVNCVGFKTVAAAEVLKNDVRKPGVLGNNCGREERIASIRVLRQRLAGTFVTLLGFLLVYSTYQSLNYLTSNQNEPKGPFDLDLVQIWWLFDLTRLLAVYCMWTRGTYSP